MFIVIACWWTTLVRVMSLVWLIFICVTSIIKITYFPSPYTSTPSTSTQSIMYWYYCLMIITIEWVSSYAPVCQLITRMFMYTLFLFVRVLFVSSIIVMLIAHMIVGIICTVFILVLIVFIILSSPHLMQHTSHY